MTREEAIKKLHWFALDNRDKQIIDMAIEALSEQSLINKDAVSREGLLKSWEELSPRGRTEFDQVIMTIPALPSADTDMSDYADRLWKIAYERGKAESEAVHGYTEWLEKIIVEAETLEWLCEDATDEEWCEKNCNYASIQAKCLRHIYEVSKGGEEE